MEDLSGASGVRRICPRCGSLTDASARFCKKCGFGFTSSAAADLPSPAQYAATTPVHGNRSTILAIVIAVLAGLVIGGVLFYRVLSEKTAPASATSHSNVATVPAVSSESTPSVVKPPPEADALVTRHPATFPEVARVSKQEDKQTVVPISSVDTPPMLINGGAKTSAAPPAIPTAPAKLPAPESAPIANSARRHAIQETEAESQSVPPSSAAR